MSCQATVQTLRENQPIKQRLGGTESWMRIDAHTSNKHRLSGAHVIIIVVVVVIDYCIPSCCSEDYNIKRQLTGTCNGHQGFKVPTGQASLIFNHARSVMLSSPLHRASPPKTPSISSRSAGEKEANQGLKRVHDRCGHRHCHHHRRRRRRRRHHHDHLLFFFM